ncbi:MAG: holo-ACP synthase [Bacilli bacterium]
MIFGIGIDVVSLVRVESILARTPRFVERILTPEELARFQLLSGKRKCEYLGGRFAAKEAFSKAYGTGIGKHLSFQDISIGTNEFGAPIIICEKLQNKKAFVSITHTDTEAFAQVIIEA